MTSAEAAPNGHRVFQPPASLENPAELNSADLPAIQDNNNHFPASAYHVPPKVFTPSPHPRQPGEYAESAKRLGHLPGRCQFMFSDGRQCTMARSDIHPSLCFYHADREEQLFGDPSSRFETRKLDFPELYSACRDLSTAAGVNRALAQVFRLLAQRRISRQEAATFGHLAKLLLRTISLMNAESTIQSGSSPRPPAKVTNGMSFRRSTESNWSEGPLSERSTNATSPVILSERSERRISPEFSSQQEFPPSRLNQVAARAESPEVVIPKTSSPISAPAACSESLTAPAAGVNSQRISTSVASASNSPKISTYENVELQPIQNQHLHTKHTKGETCSSGRPPMPAF